MINTLSLYGELRQDLDRMKQIESREDKMIVFKQSRQIFKLFHSSNPERGLQVHDNYTYQLLYNFLGDLCDHLENIDGPDMDLDTFYETLIGFQEKIYELALSYVDIYSADLAQWLTSPESHSHYVNDVLRAMEWNEPINNVLSEAQRNQYIELYEDYLYLLIEYIKARYTNKKGKE